MRRTIPALDSRIPEGKTAFPVNIQAKLAEIRHQLNCNVEIIKRDYPSNTPGLPHVIEMLNGHVTDRLNELETLLKRYEGQ